MAIKPSVYQDGNGRSDFDTDWGLRTAVTLNFDNSVPNANTLFTVTGTVLLRLLAICQTDLAGASATLEVGISGDTAKLIAQSTATDIDAGEIWHDVSPDSKVEASSVMAENIVSNDIIATIGTANITSGSIKFIAYWYPLTENGNVSAVSGGVVTAYSASASSSESPSSSVSESASKSLSPSSSESKSPSLSASPSGSESNSVSASASPSGSESRSLSVSTSSSRSASNSSSESVSVSKSDSPSRSVSESASPSPFFG